LVVVLCLVVPSVVLAISSSEHAKVQFHKFVQQYKKPYVNNATEYEVRFKNFLDTLVRIRKLEGNPQVKVGITKFADMSIHEFSTKVLLERKTNGASLATSCLATGVTAKQIENPQIPDSFDWRTKHVVTPVKDQGECGSCWAFSTIGTIESHWALKGHNLTQFSEQLLVDCSNGCSNEPPYGPVCNQGCNGGWQWNAYFDIISWGGVETEVQYPYTAVTGSCQINKKLLQAKVKSYVCMSNQTVGAANEDQMAAYLVQTGPLAIAMDADILQDYDSGIVDPWFPNWDCDPTSLDHALLIVGYGVESSEIWGKTPYWIVKNSWGADWGENGYFRIVRGTGACGLSNAVSSVIMQ